MKKVKQQLVELSIEVTNECQLACVHCSSGSSPKRMPDELGFQEHMRLVREARALGATVLSLSGGNPLMYEMLPALVAGALWEGYERVLIYTTGHNREAELLEGYPDIDKLIKDDRITWIFSLHSHDPQINDKIMLRPNACLSIQESIRYVVSMGRTAEVHMVPMQPNFTHVHQVRELCRQLGVKKLSLLRFVPQTRGKINFQRLGMTISEFVRLQMIIDEEMRIEDHPVQLRAGCPMDFRHSIDLLDKKAKPCHAGDDLILVRPTGDVHPCAAWKSLPADSNVREHSLAEIWKQSAVFTSIRDFKAAGYLGVEGCASCSYVDSCQTGCPAQRLHALGATSMDALMMPTSDPLCVRGNGHEFINLALKR